MLAVNGVGKPCAGEPHAGIDGRELETEHTTDHGDGEELPDGKPTGHTAPTCGCQKLCTPHATC